MRQMTQKEKNKTLIIPLGNVVLSVNGKQAQQMLSTLQRDASNMEKKIAKAATQTIAKLTNIFGSENCTILEL